jgi:hypothetical protein
LLVYANQLWISPNPERTEGAVSAVGSWLSRKTKGRIGTANLKNGFRKRLSDGKEVHVYAVERATDDEVELMAIKFAHPDAVVRGRLWTTEIGIRQISPKEAQLI